MDKNEAEVRFNNGMAAAFDGNGLVFTSDGSFAGQPTGQFQTSYLSRRGLDGWSTKGIQMPNGRVFVANGYSGFTEDLSKGVIRWMEDTSAGTFDPNAVPGLNMYLHDEAAGSFTLLNGTLSEAGSEVKFGWGSADFGKVGFETIRRLTPDAPCTNLSACTYEWDHGVVRLASVLPDGTPSTGTIGAGQKAAQGGAEGNIDNAVSRDGSRVFFSTGIALYVRENGSQTTLISGSERSLPGGVSNGPVYFQGAEAAHGTRVIFTTQRSLVDADTDETNDLYMYDASKPVGNRLMLISEDKNPEAPEGAAVDPGNGPENVSGTGGVLARSSELDRVYFVTDNQILPGEPNAAGPKLYVWDDTGASPQLHFIGILSPEDALTWDGPSVRESRVIKPARISADGRFLAFMSVNQLTPADQDDQADVYRYDAQAQALTCVSCTSDAFPSEGEIRFDQTRVGANLVNHLPRNVSDSGQVFFQTNRGLVPADSNGKVDVYEFENGELFLLSGGSGTENSYFLDAGASGNDVFFDTRDRLVGWDEDSKYDAYDARVGGGFPEPPPLPPPCEGDSCQSPPVVPNDPSPASSTFTGPGNVKVTTARRCPKGKVRRQGRCRKKPRHHQKHAQHKTGGKHG